MLLTACEELGSPREDISSNRSKELKKLMSRQVSHISLVLTTILESVLDNSGLAGNSNRPSPSPSSGILHFKASFFWVGGFLKRFLFGLEVSYLKIVINLPFIYKKLILSFNLDLGRSYILLFLLYLNG